MNTKNGLKIFADSIKMGILAVIAAKLIYLFPHLAPLVVLVLIGLGIIKLISSD